MKKFLVVVDTQYDFMMPGGALYVPGAEELIVPSINFLSKINHDEYAGVLFTADTHERETYYSLPESQQFPIHCVKGEAGWQNVFNHQLVDRKVPVYYLNKGVFSMWEEDEIKLRYLDRKISAERPIIDFVHRDAFFQNLEIKSIEVMGVASDYCVKWAVDGFAKRGFEVEVLGDLCRGINVTAKETFDAAEYADNVVVL